MISKKILLIICLLSTLNSGCAKSVDSNNNENSISQQQPHSEGLNDNDIRSKAEKGDSESQYNR